METKNLFNQILDESIEKKLLVSIFDDRANTGSFKMGYVLVRFEDTVLLHAFDKYSQYAGYILVPIGDIFKIGQKTEYNDDLDIVYQESPFLLHHEMVETISSKANGISAIIEFCFHNKIFLSTYYYCGESISGFVRELDDEYFLLDSYFSDGSYEGAYLVQKSNISQIDFDSLGEKKIERLINKKLKHR